MNLKETFWVAVDTVVVGFAFSAGAITAIAILGKCGVQ